MTGPHRFQAHLEIAHRYWKDIIQLGDSIIDATCGNGQDTLILAKNALSENSGALFAFDIQEKAIANTQQLLKQNLSEACYKRIQFFQSCHSQFPDEIPPTIKLVVYNLGYLPGGNKSLTTQVETTLKSIMAAQNLILKNGAISITCYPGHTEGKLEEAAILNYLSSLNPKDWRCCYHQWINRKDAPTLVLLTKL
jgi:hypothetical protein